MKTKLPKIPNQSTATIGDMVKLAEDSKEAPYKSPSKCELRSDTLESAEQYKRLNVLHAPWVSRYWILEAVTLLNSLPHLERLEITGRQIGKYVHSDDAVNLRKAAKLMGKRLEHIEFNYFTLGATMKCK